MLSLGGLDAQCGVVLGPGGGVVVRDRCSDGERGRVGVGGVVQGLVVCWWVDRVDGERGGAEEVEIRALHGFVVF